MAETENIVACDWGGTNFRGVMVEVGNDGGLSLLEDTYNAFPTAEAGSVDEVLQRGIGEIRKGFRGAIHGIACDIAGPVHDHAILLGAANIGVFHGQTPFNVRGRIEELFQKRTVVSNDLEAALAGEVTHGSLQGAEWAMLENIGTGWGGARLYNGVPVAAEPGHAWMPGEGRVCGCGKLDCAEAVVSGAAIRRKVEDVCMSLGVAIPHGKHPCAFADEEAANGTDWAVTLYTELAMHIGGMWGSTLNNCPLIDRIAYMGSFIERAMRIGAFQDEVRRAMLARSMFPARHESVAIHEATSPRLATGEPVGPLYGAASIWRQQVER